MKAFIWLGRHGPAALAVMVLVGIATPALGAVLRPYVAEAVFILLVLAFMRADIAALGTLARRPMLILAAVAWTICAVPVLALLLAKTGALAALGPDMPAALLLQAASLPMMAAPALAALIGLDATLALAGLLLASALVPLTTPAFLALGDAGIALSGQDLAIRLAGILAGAAILGLCLRRALGAARAHEHRLALDGLNIVVLFVFISSVMGDVGPALMLDAGRVLRLTAVGFVVNLALLAGTAAAFALFTETKNALTVGLLASQRNLGLMLAVAGSYLSETVWLYFAVSQIPIYLAPVALRPWARGRLNS